MHFAYFDVLHIIADAYTAFSIYVSITNVAPFSI